MTSKHFLFNDTVLILEAATDPRLNPSFPLTKEQYEVLTVDDLLRLLRDEVHSDPDLVQHHPKILLTLCAMLSAKGGINCVRVHWDGYGVSSRHGQVPETSLAVLASLEGRGRLTAETVDEVVWSKLSVA